MSKSKAPAPQAQPPVVEVVTETPSPGSAETLPPEPEALSAQPTQAADAVAAAPELETTPAEQTGGETGARVKMKVGMSGTAYSLAPGDERPFPADEAQRLVDAGFASFVDGSA